MGNTNSNKRERTYSSDSDGSTLPSGKDDKVFEFSSGLRKLKFLYQPSLEDNDESPGSSTKGKCCNSASHSSAECAIPESELEPSQFPIVFKWEGGGKEVFISGSFSNWKPIPMVKSHGDFALILDIPEGDHEYKFQVDGEWLHSSDQPTVNNDMGTKNNIVSVKKNDFEVFEALAMDSNSRAHSSSANPDFSEEPFSQEIPQRRPYDRSIIPPVLPPHLLEVILNKDVSLNNEPILLPEPNHVMLNHLYALSIKDDVMILSATLRYRKKYVTTLMYKPI